MMSSPVSQSAEGLFAVAGTRPVAGYIGGKRNLAKRIVDRISTTPHTAYAEPFVGMGGIFFRRTLRPRAEYINDWSKDVSTLFRILQRHYPQFMDTIKWQLSGRTEFRRMMASDPATLTDLERAARFLYVQRLGFGGKVVGRTFGLDAHGAARWNIAKLATMLEDVHERLAGVVIECLPWPDFLARYDRPGTLFYCDPPYFGCEKDYGDDAGQPLFSVGQFEQLAGALARLKGRFILSLNDVPEVRSIFSRFRIEAVETTYTIGACHNAKRAGEVIISGP